MDIVNEFEKMSMTCGICIKNGAILNWVLTASEVTSIFPVEDSTLRNWVMQGLFSPTEYKGSGKVLIFTLEGVVRVLKEKGMYDKEFFINGKRFKGERMLYKEKIKGKSKPLTLWVSSDEADYASVVFLRKTGNQFAIELRKLLSDMFSATINTVIVSDELVTPEFEEDIAHVSFVTLRDYIRGRDNYSDDFVKCILEISDAHEYLVHKIKQGEKRKDKGDEK